jgi:hypothetical protein
MYEQKVKLNDEHRYFHADGSEYVGFSKLFDAFMTKPFDAEMAALGTAKSEGISKSDVLARWNGQRDEGTRIDAAIDYYCSTGFFKPEDEDIADGVKEVLKVYEGYHKSYGQQVLYSEKYKVAGTCDRLSLISNRKLCPFIMSDFKCFEKEISMMPGSVRFLNPPFNHLANTKYIRICFQTSFYSFLAEEMTGRVPIRQFIHWIDPRTMKRDENGELNVKHKLIDCPYLKNDVILFLETYKEKILTLTNKAEVSAW